MGAQTMFHAWTIRNGVCWFRRVRMLSTYDFFNPRLLWLIHAGFEDRVVRAITSDST